MNLMAAIEKENLGYSKDVSPYPNEGWDFIVTCKRSRDLEKGGVSFDFDDVLPVLNDFGGYGVEDYVNSYVGGDKVNHVVEIRVRK